ncbi:hypothetical protein ACFFQW_03090 [Umezawaea endophytica]|uniref:Uncharacterized protein n=1 Tax=Umezawaea endophytica TaxID=1654476 RepID=A0A9X3AFT3_9PSEU|nr:hypothetical protein [Umezawaea endophytica]MCS7479132.1 hypothetical protein [Umezawaea endophytica]
MPPRPVDDSLGDDTSHQPFWAHARIDGTALDVLITLARALATRWVAQDVAERFGHSVALEAATVVMGSDGTFDLWEEPGRLMCHIARSGAPGGTAPQPNPQRLRLASRTARTNTHEARSAIVVERSPGRVTLSLSVPFE